MCEEDRKSHVSEASPHHCLKGSNSNSESHQWAFEHISGAGNLLPKLMPISFCTRVSLIFEVFQTRAAHFCSALYAWKCHTCSNRKRIESTEAYTEAYTEAFKSLVVCYSRFAIASKTSGDRSLFPARYGTIATTGQEFPKDNLGSACRTQFGILRTPYATKHAKHILALRTPRIFQEILCSFLSSTNWERFT